MNPLFAERNNPFQGCGCNCLVFVVIGGAMLMSAAVAMAAWLR